VSPRLRVGLLLGGILVLFSLVLGSAATGASGQVCMGVVIDDGGYGGGNTPAVQSAGVASGSNDLQALQAARDTVYQNNSGLVCAIDDGTGQVPANGVQNCLTSSGGLYYYWSYWEGDPYTNTWTYAQLGPASHTVSSGQTYVEGWRYQNPGPDNPSAPEPSITPAAAFAQACPGVTPVSASVAGGGGGSSGGSSGGGGGGGGSSGGGASSPGAATAPASSATTTSTSAGQSAPATRGTTVSGGATTTTSQGPSPSTTSDASPTTTTSGSGKASKPKGTTAVLGARTGHVSTGSGDPVLPVALVGVVIAVLAALAWWRWRRRPAEE
jgi:uncharacterized membrane protein YgcG